MGLGEELQGLITEVSEELVAEVMNAPFCAVKLRIWPWVVGGALDERQGAVLEVLEELGFAGCSVAALGRQGEEGELRVYAHVALLDGSSAELHKELAGALRELASWPIKVRSYWLPLVNWESEHGDAAPG